MGAGSLTILYSNENTLFCMNPQITYFKSVFRKYTKFVMTDYHHTISENKFSNNNNDISFNHPTLGDLLAQVSVQIDLDETADKSWDKFPNNIGTALFKNILFKYDNNEIENVSSEYINFTSMLNNSKSFNSIYDIVEKELVCNNGNNYQRMALSGGVFTPNSMFGATPSTAIDKMKAIVPIPFSFSKNVGSAFPLFLLTKNDVNILLQPNPFDGLFHTDATKNDAIPELFKFSLIYKYIYLSEDERNRFKSSPQEYLVEKVKFSDTIRLNQDVKIDFRSVVPNLPVKCIYLVNKSKDDNKLTQLYNNYKYQFFIRGVNLQQQSLPHEYYSKLNIIENFKGCVYDKWDQDSPLAAKTVPSINSNIAYIPLNLKNAEGPSGCINTGTNEFRMEVTFQPNEAEIGHPGYDVEHTDIYIYLVYYSIMRISENKHLSFPYGNN